MFGHVDETCPCKRHGDSKDARTIAELVRKAKEVEAWQVVALKGGLGKVWLGLRKQGVMATMR